MKILVSACLLGENCKYNGGNNLNSCVKEYLKQHEIISICPEVLAGMSIPRPCAEICDEKVIDIKGNDVTAEYKNAVSMAIQNIKELKIDFVILQSRSPTCAVNKIYDGHFHGKLIRGSGLFAKALIDNGYTVIDAEEFQSMEF